MIWLRLLLFAMSVRTSVLTIHLKSAGIEDYCSFWKSVLLSFFDLLLQYFFFRKYGITSFKALLFGAFKHIHFVFNRNVLARSFQHKLRKFNVWRWFDCFTLILVCLCYSLLSFFDNFFKKPNVIEMCIGLIPCCRRISFRLFHRPGASHLWALFWVFIWNSLIQLRDSFLRAIHHIEQFRSFTFGSEFISYIFIEITLFVYYPLKLYCSHLSVWYRCWLLRLHVMYDMLTLYRFSGVIIYKTCGQLPISTLTYCPVLASWFRVGILVNWY